MGLLHGNGLSDRETCLFNDLFQIFMRKRPRYFKSYEQIITELVVAILHEITVEGHAYGRHLEEAMERIKQELSQRRIGIEFRENVMDQIYAIQFLKFHRTDVRLSLLYGSTVRD